MNWFIHEMTYNGLFFDIVCLTLMGALYGCMRAYGHYLRKQIDKEKRDLLKWQRELEIKSSNSRNKR